MQEQMKRLLGMPKDFTSLVIMQKLYALPLCLLLLLWIPPAKAVQVTNIRLMNGTNASVRVGRIEIQVINNNTWGSICDDSWDSNDAIVACRMLLYFNGGTAVTDTRYGTGSFTFLMDDTSCTGDEASLSECMSSQNSDCSRGSDNEAGVECNENLAPGQSSSTRAPTTTAPGTIISGNCQTSPTVRLYSKQKTNGTGYVEVLQTGTVSNWGFVCDDSWSSEAARIACAQMCYPTNYIAKPGIPAEYEQKPPTPNIILDNVNCFGNETTLQDCPHNAWNVQNCISGELAGVQCVAAPFLPPAAPVPDLICGEGKIIAQFSRARDINLEAKHLSVFNQPNCPDVTKSTTNDFVSIIIRVDKCGTTVTRNGTHIIYFNEIKYDFTSQEDAITRVNIYRVDVTCYLPVDVEVTNRIEPVTQAVTQSSIGNFQVSLLVYRNDSFTVPATENPVQIPLGEYLNVAFTMEEYDPNLKLVVTDCVTSPTGDFGSPPLKVLFAEKCSQEDTLSFYPLSNFRFGFRFKPFKFVGYDILYIRCNATICLASANTQECDRTCQNTKPNVTITTGRRKRSSNAYSASATSPAIILYDPYASGPNFGNFVYATAKTETQLVTGSNYPVSVQNTTLQNIVVTTSRSQQQSEKATSKQPQREVSTASNQQQGKEIATSKTQQQEKSTKQQEEETTTSKTPQQEKLTTSKSNQQNQTRPTIRNASVADDNASHIIYSHTLLLFMILLTILLSM